MIVFRLSKSACATDLSGMGARIAGGRWNGQGIPVIYTSESRALCTTEIAVHTGMGLLPSDYRLISIMIPDGVPILTIEIEKLPPGWRSFPFPPITRNVGDQFVKRNQHLVLKVPSVVVPGDFNFLINPSHPDMRLIRIIKTEPFDFDQRLFRRR